MQWKLIAGAGACAVAAGIAGGPAAADGAGSIELVQTGRIALPGVEIAAYDRRTARLYVTDAAGAKVHIVDVADRSAPAFVGSIDTAPGTPTSVAVRRGVVAVAIAAPVETDPGTVGFYDRDGHARGTVTVGALPDMLTFTPDGRTVLVANEGQPEDADGAYGVDPEGSVSVIDVRTRRVRTADLDDAGYVDPSVRRLRPSVSLAVDAEPEYIAVDPDGDHAWVTLQEANAVARLDVERARFTSVRSLGLKDHGQPGAGLDPSDRDGAIGIRTAPVHGMYMPDAIAAFRDDDRTFLVTANEGDARDLAGDERRVSSLTLDPVAFPDGATLKQNANLGRLNVSAAGADTDDDGDIDRLQAFGGRSISIWTSRGRLVWDSGDILEQQTAAAAPTRFNSDGTATTFDTRSDNKGPEPEGVAVGRVAGRRYAFVGLERVGGVATFDITDPRAPGFVSYTHPDPETDIAPEGILFVAGRGGEAPMLVVSNEVSNTVQIIEIRRS